MENIASWRATLSGLSKRLEMYTKTPLAPEPNRASEMAMNAKW
jgi:hypothetical protein